jgi:hypothetical protein
MTLAGVSRTEPTLSILNFLRQMISETSEGEGVVWTVFAPKTVLGIWDSSGTSPFFNIFSIHRLGDRSGQRDSLKQSE